MATQSLSSRAPRTVVRTAGGTEAACQGGSAYLYIESKIPIKSFKIILLAVGTVVACVTTPAIGAGSNALFNFSVVSFICQAIF